MTRQSIGNARAMPLLLCASYYMSIASGFLASSSSSRVHKLRATDVDADAEAKLWPTWDASVAEDAALLYMPFLEHQLGALKDLGAVPLTDTKQTSRMSYAEKVSKEGEPVARVGSKIFEVEGLFRRVRMTYFDGGNSLQVFNSLWYPSYDRVDAPMLGIDLLSFGPKKLLCVVDAQPLRGRDDDEGNVAHATERLDAIRAAHAAELGGEVSSRWYDDNRFFSKQMLYSRFEETGKKGVEDSLRPAFSEYLQAYLDVVKESRVDEGHIETAKEAQRDYDGFNAERDPAHGLFTSYFGEDWANDFVHDFLFQLSDPKTPPPK